MPNFALRSHITWLNYVTAKRFYWLVILLDTTQALCFVHGHDETLANKNMEQKTLLGFITISLYQLWFK